MNHRASLLDLASKNDGHLTELTTLVHNLIAENLVTATTPQDGWTVIRTVKEPRVDRFIYRKKPRRAAHVNNYPRLRRSARRPTTPSAATTS